MLPPETSPSFTRDQQWWQGLRNGDRQAYEAIFRQYVQHLRNYAHRFALPRPAVDDCLQDLFEELWQKRERLAPQVPNLRFYLMRALRNRIFRRLAQQKKWAEPSHADEYAFMLTTSAEQTMIEEELATEQIARLNLAVQQLSERQREAIYLRYYLGHSYEEVAELLGVEQQSAYNLIFRALASLRKNVGQSTLAWWLLGWALAG
ncbi:MAG: sigma-70 family RNA polymerase sigma factor [Bernardetiaceae bacterium]|jgi:RNA polymerase sigma factor (sigma-70 family)|nr:sigma-70 family RNA polymerase sigma factor [Bernardetiaceae bacterium]